MTENVSYSIHLEEKFGSSTLIDIPALVTLCREQWYKQTLCRVDGCAVRLAIIRGEFHWHKHDSQDELFLTLEGKLLIDLKDKTVELGPHQAYSVPKGVIHRTRAPKKAVILLVEGAGVDPIGDRE